MEISKEKCCLITENAKNDNIMPTDELSNLLGVDFYEVLSSVFNERLEKALSLAKKSDFSGFDWITNFDENGFARIELNNKLNLIDANGKVISKLWFDDIDDFDKNGFAKVELNDKWNFIDKKGNLLSKQWFDNCFDAAELSKNYV